MGWKGHLYFRISDLVKNPDGTDVWACCGEFRWSPESLVSQIHSPRLHDRGPGIFSDLFKVYSGGKERVGSGKQREATAPIHP